MTNSSPFFSRPIFDQLTQPGSRLSWLENWLLKEVWSRQRYEAAEDVVQDYLIEGEKTVREMEEILAAAAQRIYDELLETPQPNRDLWHFLTARRPAAAVIFDGLSLREIPVLMKLAEESNLKIIEFGVSFAAIPSETIDFTEQRLRLSAKVAPSTLPSRTELQEVGITSYYLDSPRDRRQIDPAALSILLWSAFPDQTYRDSEARFSNHFATINTVLQTAWQNTVQQIPSHRTILITSDHGYIFFGSGLSAPRTNDVLKPLSKWFGSERNIHLTNGQENIIQHPDIKLIPEKQVAMIRGRVQTHTTGPDSSKLYKHGGLSVMEMLTPWIILESE